MTEFKPITFTYLWHGKNGDLNEKRECTATTKGTYEWMMDGFKLEPEKYELLSCKRVEDDHAKSFEEMKRDNERKFADILGEEGKKFIAGLAFCGYEMRYNWKSGKFELDCALKQEGVTL